MMIKSELLVPEKQAVQLLVNNIDGSIQTTVIYSLVDSFDALIKRVSHLQQNEDKLGTPTSVSAMDQQGCNNNRRQWNNSNN